MRQLIRIGLDRIEGWILVGDALAIDAITETQNKITTAELAEALAMNPEAAVLDVRGAGEYAESHVEGAKNIAYTRLAARISEVPTGKPLFVHCGSGLRASFAVPFLASKGFDVVHVDGAFGEIPQQILS